MKPETRRRTLKFLHEIGTVGVMGGVLAQLVLSWTGAAMDPAGHATVRQVIVQLCTWLLFPSLLLVLVSGVLAMANNKAFHSADWVIVKALMTPLVFEATLVAVWGPARQAATLTAKVAGGDASAADGLADVLWHEQGGLWIALFLFTTNVVLSIWRPKRRSRPAEPTSEPASA